MHYHETHKIHRSAWLRAAVLNHGVRVVDFDVILFEIGVL